MRWIRVVGCVGAVVLLIAGCDSSPARQPGSAAPTTHPSTASSPPPPPTITGPTLPVVVASPISPELPASQLPQSLPDESGRPILNQVLDELTYSTRNMIKVAGDITPACAGNRINLGDNAHTACTTTFGGATIPWDVSIGAYSATDALVQYNVSPEGAILIGARVYADFWSSHHDQSDQLRCDTIPAAVAVPLIEGSAYGETATSYHCEYLGPAQQNTRTWTVVPVTIDQYGNPGFTP